MKRLIIILAVLMLLSGGLFAQAGERDLSIGIVGMATFNQEDETAGDYNFFENSIWGVTGRLMLTDNIGVNADFLYVMRKYYDHYVGNYDYFWGPNPASYYSTTDDELDGYEFYEDKFLLNINIGGYLPLGMFQPFAQVGPTFTVTTMNDDVYNLAYEAAFNAANEDSVVGMGYNMKFGCDLFVSEDWSFSLAYTMLEPSFGDFFEELETEGCGYVFSQGYFTLDVLLWL